MIRRHGFENFKNLIHAARGLNGCSDVNTRIAKKTLRYRKYIDNNDLETIDLEAIDAELRTFKIA